MTAMDKSWYVCLRAEHRVPRDFFLDLSTTPTIWEKSAENDEAE